MATPEYLVLPEPLRPKQLHHLHTWPSQGQTQVLQGSPGPPGSFIHGILQARVLEWGASAFSEDQG